MVTHAAMRCSTLDCRTKSTRVYAELSYCKRLRSNQCTSDGRATDTATLGTWTELSAPIQLLDVDLLVSQKDASGGARKVSILRAAR